MIFLSKDRHCFSLFFRLDDKPLSRPGIQPRSVRALSPSAQQALWPINSGLAHYAKQTG